MLIGKSLVVFFLTASSLGLFAQSLPGSIMVVGGGSEDIGGWSDEPYSWVVQQSQTKRVAIIGASGNVTEWLPEYFMDHCGATYAKNFVISSSATADSQETYDSLLTYDAIFFRGGDQYDYYSRYKGTLTEQAVIEIFQSGGVVGGTSAGLHILSEVMFIARYGSVYPEEALEDPYNQYMTLADDFLPLVPGVLFDSHVAERARFGRIMGMLGRWELDGHEAITGIGVDDKTALCVGKDMDATVHGTGAANIYRQGEGNVFSLSGSKLLASHLDVMQLLDGCTLNLATFDYTGLSQPAEPALAGETFPGRLWLSGSDVLMANQEMLAQVAEEETINDSLLIITGSGSEAQEMAAYLQGMGLKTVIMEASPLNGNDPEWRRQIRHCPKYIFAGNEYLPLMDFLKGTENGMLMLEMILGGEKTLAFIGGDSRFAGKIVIKNYEQEYASYEGLLEYDEGLGLLSNTIVIPNTFSTAVDMENAATGVPYGMIMDGLRYGIWLFDDSFVRYERNGSIVRLRSFGDFPMILAENPGTLAGLAEVPATGTGNPRNIAGFGNFIFRLMDETVSLELDYVGDIDEVIYNQRFLVYPNPAGRFIFFSTILSDPFVIEISSLKGETIFKKILKDGDIIHSGGWNSGAYILNIFRTDGSLITSKKIIIQ